MSSDRSQGLGTRGSGKTQARSQKDRVTESDARRPLVEVGIMIVGKLDQVDESAVEAALEDFQNFVESEFPNFRWHFVLSRRPESIQERRTAPSVLLQQALYERDEKHWDMAFVLTSAELQSYYSPHCFAALSRPLDAAVFSMSLIDPRAVGDADETQTRVATIAKRLNGLLRHALGHLVGLSRESEPTNLMYRPSTVKELDAMHFLTPEQLSAQKTALEEIADQRLEEQVDKPADAVSFFVRSAVINFREIVAAIAAARSWQFPRRLSSLTLASASTLVVLLLTAESWDLALSQSWPRLIVLVALAWLATTTYVVVRQDLTVPNRQRPSEQIVVTNVSAIGIVFTGMLVTWVTLATVSAGIVWFLFDSDLIAAWAASLEVSPDQIGWLDRMRMVSFSASLGLFIGALGTSFESQHYFRHIIFVDEEI